MNLEISKLESINFLSRIGICCTFYEQQKILKCFTNNANKISYEIYLYNLDIAYKNFKKINLKKKYNNNSYFIFNLKNYNNLCYINNFLDNYNYYLCILYNKSQLIDVSKFDFILFYKNSFSCRSILYKLIFIKYQIEKKIFLKILNSIKYKWILLDLSDYKLYYLEDLIFKNFINQRKINYSLTDILYYS